MKPSDIISLRLQNLLVSSPIAGSPADVLRWLCASQAQDFAGAKWALGLRLKGAVDSQIEQAFNSGSILRTHVLRPTWHFVAPDDIHWLLELTAPHVHRLNGSMYRQLELDDFVFEESNRVLAAALENGRQLTRDELGEALAQEGINVSNRLRLAYILMQAELNGLICSGRRDGRQFTYALLGERAPEGKRLTREQALAELAGRFFHSRGPATDHDFSKWSGLTLNDARSGLDSVKARLYQEQVNGKTYWFSETNLAAPEVSPAVYLLSAYDEFISSYKDHSIIAAPEVGTRLAALGNALQNVIVVGSQIVGSWRRNLTEHAVFIEISLLTALSKSNDQVINDQVIMEATRRYGEFVGLAVEMR